MKLNKAAKANKATHRPPRHQDSMRGFFQVGVGLTDKGEIEEGICEFYSQLGPKLTASITREKEGAFLDYMG